VVARPRHDETVRELPSGTVTFLFTDVEGSTRLLSELGDAYADLLDEHRRLLREVFVEQGGVEVDTQGDAFFVAFSRARDALAAARDAQRVLGDGPVRVRVGLHTGEPLLTEEGYVGIDVHRAARIAAAGHGGQILVSQSTRDLVGADELCDLGRHRLKDLTAPERIYQLGDESFPPLKTLDRTNLPVTATPLVGRRSELAELVDLLRDGSRLVTVTGAGGSGKTRLALQVAAELADDFGDGVFFVPLAPLQDAALVGSTIVQSAGVRAVEDLHLLEVLLVLDNLEHLLPAAAELSSLLAAAPTVKLLATSRVRLNVSAEFEFPLEPFPDAEAVEFFVERARAVKRDVRGDAAVEEICHRLDGLPLALELAASRVKVLDPPLLVERLGQRLPVLTGGGRDVPERQQTLRATIEWSYQLLEERLQAAFRRLAVFAGSFSLDAAEQVAQIELEEIAGLVDWSLLKPIGEGRFLMLETIREFARELLEETDEAPDVHSRHVDHVLALVEQAEPRLTGPDQREWYERLTLEQDNVREALAYACGTGDAERALMVAGTIWRFWWTRAAVEEPAHWYKRAFGLNAEVSETAQARAIFGWAHVAESRGANELARKQFEEAAERLGRLGETRWQILALTHLAIAYRRRGDRPRAEALNEEALELALRSGDIRGAAVIRGNMGTDLRAAGEDERARVLFEESLDGSRVVGDIYMIANCLMNLAEIALHGGELMRAAGGLRESIELFTSIGDRRDLVRAIAVGAALVRRGDPHMSARLAAAADALCAAQGIELDQEERRLIDEAVVGLREELGERFEEAWNAGAELELEPAVELALHTLDPPPQ
jgi:predicted ATPase/class 3 adenylate cyclase